jgi:hypothetical protein
MKVLMGIDDSKFSEDVIQAVVTQLRPENTEVLILHVLEPISFLAPPEMAQGYAPELEERKKPAHEFVERFAKKLRRAGFEASTAAEIGDVRVSILDTATEWRRSHCDWFTLAERHREFLNRQCDGIRCSPCQMLCRNRSHESGNPHAESRQRAGDVAFQLRLSRGVGSPQRSIRAGSEDARSP